MPLDILEHSALGQAELLRRRELSALELARIYLDRIERHDHQLSSFVTVMRSQAERAARRADARLASGDGRAPFLGVPTAIKDLVPVRGARTMLGSRAYRHFWPPYTGLVAQRLEAAGFVSLGKTATSELGATPVTEPDVHPPTRNPHHLDFSPGGSSGGAGAAVAAGFVPVAQGSDGGGSVRIPAAFCHLYGFKPSLVLLGNLHGRFNALGLSVMGPLAHDVSDAAAMLDAMRDDHRQTLLTASRRPPRRLRVRVTFGCIVGELDPRIASAVRRTARVLEDLGHHVEEVDPPRATQEEFMPLWRWQVATAPILSPRLLQPITRWLRTSGPRMSLDEVERYQARLVERIDATFGDADIFLSATVPILPPKIGFIEGLGPAEAFDAIAPIGAYTAMFNVSWRPAASIPAGIADDGRPYGVQIAGAPGDDALLLQLSRQLEEALPWSTRMAFVGRAGASVTRPHRRGPDHAPAW